MLLYLRVGLRTDPVVGVGVQNLKNNKRSSLFRADWGCRREKKSFLTLPPDVAGGRTSRDREDVLEAAQDLGGQVEQPHRKR
jgi:hypothetical protein